VGASIALAIAGQADIAYENVEALLNDWLGFGEPDSDGVYEAPEDPVEVYFPVTGGHWSDGLDTVVDWSATAGLNFNAVIEPEHDDVSAVLEDTDAVLEAEDVNKALIDVLLNGKEKGFDVYLLLLWGDEGDPNSEELLSLADEAGIPVKDLSGGLDDIVFAEDPSDDAEPEPEPEPEPEEKPSRSQRRRKEAVAEELPDEAEELTESDVTVGEVVKPKRSRSKAKEAEPVEGQTTLEDQIAQAAHEKRVPTTIEVEGLADDDPLKVALVLTEERARELVREEIGSFLLAIVMDMGLIAPAIAQYFDDAVEATGAPETPQEPEVAEEAAPEAPKRSGRGGRPRKDGSPAQPQKKAYLVDEAGEYSRRGRGKPRKGSTVVELTKAEAEDLGLDWS
jgi:hypothetical protein